MPSSTITVNVHAEIADDGHSVRIIIEPSYGDARNWLENTPAEHIARLANIASEHWQVQVLGIAAMEARGMAPSADARRWALDNGRVIDFDEDTTDAE